MLTPQQRTARARIGANARVAKYGADHVGRAVVDGNLKFYLRQVDPEGLLDPEDRLHRALAARRAQALRAALASSKAAARRRLRKAVQEATTA